VPLDIEAEVAGLDPDHPSAVRTVRGQVSVATARGQIRSVSLVPPKPPACPEAVAAVLEADWVVLGPGSWFSSVIPHLLVPELAEALVSTSARRLVALNLAPQPGETSGFAPETHLDVLAAHAAGLRVDVVLADAAVVAQTSSADTLRSAAADLGGQLVLAPVAMGDGTARHDPDLLAAAYNRVFAAGAARAAHPAGVNAAGATAGIVKGR
jgi:uncharacterized cofD-like protein